LRRFILSVIVFLFLQIHFITTIQADNSYISEPSDLYGISALLMDAESKEILYRKNEKDQRAVASTTKVLTCLIALENCQLDEIVTFSKYASSQPDVQMNAMEGEQYYLKDLLIAMMLESYNDVSVAVAEHVSGTAEAFSLLMNEYADDLGCSNSFFITPNGLDASINGRENVSTAMDMGIILSYAIQNDKFLDITQMTSYSFEELTGKRHVAVNNKNQMLSSYDGMITGKTGFTNKAGYCYVGAAKRDDRTFVVVTLGSGWPPNKSYKWSDARALLDYAFEHFHYKEIDYGNVQLPDNIFVKNGVDQDGNIISTIHFRIPNLNKQLLRDDISYTGKIYYKEGLCAPVYKNDVIGKVEVYINKELVKEYPVYSQENVEKCKLWHKIWDLVR